MCPLLPLNKNYLEPKNYLEVPEWQDDSWSGNCRYIPGVSVSIKTLMYGIEESHVKVPGIQDHCAWMDIPVAMHVKGEHLFVGSK